jgi:predicted dehydrogenase
VAVSSLQGVNNFTLRKRDSADHAGVLVYYANGSLMNYGGNVYNYGSTALDTFFGVNGTVQMGGGVLSIHYGFPPGFPKPADLPQPEKVSLKGNNREGDGVVEQFRHFAKVLDGKEKPYPDAYISRQSVQVMEASVVSAREKRVIDVRELG